MLKKDKIKLAEKCLDEINKLNIKITIKNNFIVFNNTIKIPLHIILDLNKCDREFIKIYELKEMKDNSN